MKTLFEACKPRQSVFDEAKRDDTLDLANLIDNSIDAEAFFNETYITEGMQLVFETAFKRFEGKAPSGLVKLTQSMGGGKTHNMVALGLLSQNPSLRKKILGGTSTFDEEIRVVAYTGRESDIPYGIWGEIAKQLGKEELFKDYYAPLKAPGQSAWINLLKGQPTLILLDELPPYLEYARTITAGTGTLADITTNALSNLFNALGKAELHNVCLVISDLQATYEMGSGLIQKSFKNLENEIGRSSINIEPVGTTSDDLYHILRKRLFETTATEEEKHEIAMGYKEAVKEAKQMNYTNLSPEQLYTGVKDAYPFHPSIKDLFARFKENPGFQQTRGFIRLTRIMVKNLYSGNEPKAKSSYLLNAFDMDLNNSEMFSMVRSIKPRLTNAISHDIAQQGKAVAEEIDSVTKSQDMQDLSKLLLVSSLGDVTGVLNGLSIQEAVGIMVKPGRSITEIKGALEEFKVKAWYLYTDRDNRLYFKDVKNVNAELLSLVDTYSDEIAKQEIKKILAEKFSPDLKDCYQEVEVFPAIDEIEIKQDKIMLILFEPNPNGVGLQRDLAEFYDNVKYKNRVMFLTGQRNSMENLLDVSKQLKAIQSIINRMKNEDKIPESDTQYQQAQDILHKVELNLLQTSRETFITLYYPTADGFESNDFKMEFKNNRFDAEEQIRNVLIDVMKFDKNTSSDTFRRKFEVRIFTTRQARWMDLKERVATNTAWSWHHPKALEDLKSESLKKGIWIEEGGYLDKEPPAPETSVNVREAFRDEQTGEVTLKITPQNGDKVYYEINGDATPGSLEVADLNAFKTTELALTFLCVDSTGRHDTGALTRWENNVQLQYNSFDKNGKNYIELKASSPKVTIKYTTDGSNPKNSGGVYDDLFEVPNGTKFVQAIAVHEDLGIFSEPISIPITETKFEINKELPLTLTHSLRASVTADVYKQLETLNKHKAKVAGVSLQVFEKTNTMQQSWLELSFDNYVFHETESFVMQLDELRNVFFKDKNVEISMNIEKSSFEKGQHFEDWIAENKYSLESYKNSISQ
ncbi:DUF499 domain-containing protein [Cytobacillus horneckiae]|uniref:DUF499 domain-containing protein n=1 Tax=Cytobacillus horneckiae TaxID=549687 RepID=UPI002DB766EE|nr:DUF499 domain-containing protein [Cytobacillus horneckiae]MEC1157829.1 DUF499 domain-containing protein [Cytobacillus horneckiae]MED2940723.1 DUF499 domain-containing protein [Cytobacillus horneckiae]